MAGPAPFCSWLMPGSVLMSSYIDSEVRHTHSNSLSFHANAGRSLHLVCGPTIYRAHGVVNAMRRMVLRTRGDPRFHCTYSRFSMV